MKTTRQSVSGAILGALLVDNTVTKTEELGEDFLLPHSV
jgi:hypothetical protein